MTLTEQHHEMFDECTTAKQAWDAFANLFKNKNQSRRLQLREEYSSLRMHPG